MDYDKQCVMGKGQAVLRWEHRSPRTLSITRKSTATSIIFLYLFFSVPSTLRPDAPALQLSTGRFRLPSSFSFSLQKTDRVLDETDAGQHHADRNDAAAYYRLGPAKQRNYRVLLDLIADDAG